MTLFLKKEAKIYFGLKGTIRDFDKRLGACFFEVFRGSKLLKLAK